MMFLLTCDKKLTKSQLNPTHASKNYWEMVEDRWVHADKH